METNLGSTSSLQAGAHRSARTPAAERLENRIAPAYVASLAAGSATFAGDAANDTISFSVVDGLLHHDRFSAGDAGFASDADFDSSTAGDQTLAAEVGSTVSINTGNGTDTVVLGSDHRASLLKAAFTVNNPVADGDQLEVNDDANTAAQMVTFDMVSVVGVGISVTNIGAAFGTVIVRTGSGNDLIGGNNFFASSIVVESGAGNDAVTFPNLLVTFTIEGGAGDDILFGGGAADTIRGGPGNDTIVAQRGNDLIFGDDGLDRFIWNPGDGSDTMDGGLGTDLLTFNGANVAEIFTMSAVSGHFRMSRDIGSVVMDAVGVEQLDLSTLGGSDTITRGDLSATSMHVVRINLAASNGVPDGATDGVTVLGGDSDDDLRVSATTGGVRVAGLGQTLDITGADATDQLNVNGGLGFDNVFANSAASAKMVISLFGEKSSSTDPLSFGAISSLDAGKTPGAIAVGNLFGRGTVVSNDIVVVDPKSNAIQILTNGGNGIFLPAVQLGTGGKTPAGIVLEDFNGDNLIDIAVTNSGSGNVAILLNRGDSTFGAPTLFPIGKKPTVLRVGDVTGDGKLDLVAITGGNTVTTLAGAGDGTFGTPSKRSTGGTAPRDLLLADFTGDGRLDIAIANSGSNNVSLLRANPDFTFATPAKVKVGVKPTALATGDFDGDTLPDLVVTHAVSHFVSVLLNASPATTAFTSQIKLAQPGRHAPAAVAVDDLDSDGRADIVVGNTASGSVSVFLSLGSGAFRSPTLIDLDNVPPRKVFGVALADLNGDGRIDIVTSNAGTGDVSVLTRLTVSP